MKKSNIFFACIGGAAAGLCLSLCACSTNSNIVTIPVESGNSYGGPVTLPEPAPGRLIGSVPRNAVAKASAFQMNGNYADHVAVTLNSAGELTYFPAPSDITNASVPVAIGNGWYLNRQGISANSVFTKWTFDEYKALKNVPSPSEIKEAIIPGAKVLKFIVLPVSASEANSMSPAELLKFL